MITIRFAIVEPAHWWRRYAVVMHMGESSTELARTWFWDRADNLVEVLSEAARRKHSSVVEEEEAVVSEEETVVSEWSKAFRIVYPDGTTLDGIQFPSGRCVVDDPEWGLVSTAISLEALPYLKDEDSEATVEWAPVKAGEN